MTSNGAEPLLFHCPDDYVFDIGQCTCAVSTGSYDNTSIPDCDSLTRMTFELDSRVIKKIMMSLDVKY